MCFSSNLELLPACLWLHCVHAQHFCLLKAGAQDPTEDPSFSQDSVPKNQFPSQYLNYHEVPGISLPLCTRKCCAKEYYLLVLLERHFSPHSTSVHRAVPVLKGFVAFPVFALCYFHHEYLDL